MTSIIRVNYVSHVSIRAKHCEYVSQLAVICCGNKCSRFHFKKKKPMNDLTLKLTFFSNEFNCQSFFQSLLLTKFSFNLKHVISCSIIFELSLYISMTIVNNSCNKIPQHATIYYVQINIFV